jgi:DNA (cytosine-5)-methyltransferase 1
LHQQLRFIDLFAGLGGFHLALKGLGHRCVFASELDPQLRALYKKNFDMDAHGDIKQIAVGDIPEHDILCAGFPCQPYSKAGQQAGLQDPKWGDLYDHIIRIVKHRRPQFVMLENVPNLHRHDQGKTWQTMESLLRAESYDVRHEKLSPHRFGIPQIRERIFILGSLNSLRGFEWPRGTATAMSIKDVLDENPAGARKLPAQVLSCISVWQDFLNRFPGGDELPSFPIWSAEFGADYPYKRATPFAVGASALRGRLGSHGIPLDGQDDAAIFDGLPSYARTRTKEFPAWKVRFIKQNRDFYDQHRDWIDEWKPKILGFPPSLQKFEWNAKGFQPRSLTNLVLQIRASGVRAKRPTTAPSLVAMTTTQVPIITWEGRYMTPGECAKLQSMENITLPEAPTRAYAALGNAVNVQVVELVARALLGHNPAGLGSVDYVGDQLALPQPHSDGTGSALALANGAALVVASKD